mgnify:CR=1 FL=1
MPTPFLTKPPGDAAQLRFDFEATTRALARIESDVGGVTGALLRAALGASVPLYAAEYKNALDDGTCSVDSLLARCRVYAQVIAEKGDNILYRSRKRGETADAFNALAKALAILSIVAVGGVRFLGERWEFPWSPGADEPAL